MIDLTRRGFMLGATTTGLLTILPAALIAKIPELVVEKFEYETDLSFESTGPLTTYSIDNGDGFGIFINNKLVKTEKAMLNINKFGDELPDTILDLKNVFMQDNPFWLFGENVNIVIANNGLAYDCDYMVQFVGRLEE